MATVATTVAPARVGDILERTVGGERLSDDDALALLAEPRPGGRGRGGVADARRGAATRTS